MPGTPTRAADAPENRRAVAEPDRQAQAFSPRADRWLRAGALGCLAVVASALVSTYVFANRDGYSTLGVTHQQPILFSHRHHAGDLGIDCRYCHTGVERSPFAGMPSTQTCLGCHRQLFRDSPLLAPLWESERTGRPIAWQRVHDLKDHVYFDHQVHVTEGIDCTTCHGDVASQVMAVQAVDLTMLWCLDCHRHPPESVADTHNLTDCTTCHR